MPPHRRRPNPSAGQTPPVRRRKVAGLGNRPGHPESAAEQTTEQPRIPAEPETTEPAAENVSGVLDGVLGQPPARRTETAGETGDDESDIEALRAAAAAAEPPPVTEDEAADEDAADEDAAEDEAEARARTAPAASTRPAGKRRSTGRARPDNLASAESDAGTERGARYTRLADHPARSKGQRQISVAMVLAVVAVVLGALAVFFRGETDDLTSGDTNSALTDSAATSQVKGQLTNAIKQTFSYNYTDLDSTEKAVKENLVGKALCEYNLLFGEVKKYAPQQKIVLDTTVRELALVRIDGERAEALVYIDQLSTRVDVNKTVAVGGQFSVHATKQGDHWKITEFDMFGQPLFNGKPAPKC